MEKVMVTVKSGIIQHAEYEYDVEGDMLEIFFQRKAATGTIELTEGIVLRFEWETCTPLSLGFISASHLLQPGQYGEAHFELLVDEYPQEVSDKIWMMLRTSPLNQFLQVGSYTPAHTQAIRPIAAIKQSPLMLQAA